MAKRTKMIRVEESYGECDLGLPELYNTCARFLQLENGTFDIYDQSYYGGNTVLAFSGYREENEEEKEKRLDAARKEKLRKMEAKVKKEKEERDQLATLLLKYHGVLPEELNEWPS